MWFEEEEIYHADDDMLDDYDDDRWEEYDDDYEYHGRRVVVPAGYLDDDDSNSDNDQVSPWLGTAGVADNQEGLSETEEIGAGRSREDEVANHLAPFMGSKKFSDIVLHVGENSFRAHKLILCSWSEVFHKMFVDPSWTLPHPRSECGGAEVQELVEPEECHEVFHHFLRFMYTESVNLSLENVYPILTLADKYMVQDLRDACEEFLVEWIATGGSEGAVRHYGELERLGLARGQQRCLAVLEANAAYLTEAGLQSLPYALFSRLLQSSSLAVDSERDVFQMALRWLGASGLREERRHHAPELLAWIRYPHMPANQLKALLGSPLPDFLEADCHLQLERLVSQAFQWRALAGEKAYASMDGDFVQPRLYYNSSFSVISGNAHTHSLARDRSALSSDSFYKLVIPPEDNSYVTYHDQQLRIQVAHKGTGNIYMCDHVMWELSVVAKKQKQKHQQQQQQQCQQPQQEQHQQSPASELWGVTYVVQTSHDIGAGYRVAVTTRLTEEAEEGSRKPSVTLHQGTVKARFNLNVPPAMLQLTEKPDKVWLKIAAFVEGK